MNGATHDTVNAAPPARRQRLYDVLEAGAMGDRTSWLVDVFLVTLILINVGAVILQSVPALAARYEALFDTIELFSLVVFTVEYGLRLYVAVEHAPYRHFTPWRARLAYATSGPGLVDLLSVLPFWLAPVLPDDLRVILVFRVFRFVKLARYSPGVHSLFDALYAERRALAGCLLILTGATVILATLMYSFERHVQPDKFGTIPDAMWWAIVTIGTIGYGDVVPVSVAGKLIATLTILTGIIMIALPVGIIATAFAEQVHRREFIVTWAMVARVPLFSGLTAAEIADVMGLLRAETFEAGAVITRRGEAAHSMYFIAAGEIEFELDGETKCMGEGHFFGEIAVLRRARRSATVRARRRTSLLVLDAADLRALMARQPRVAARLRETVKSRIGRDLVSPHGDIVIEEVEETAEEHDGGRPRSKG
jgi:voltage-gated potassium channel